MTTSKKVGIAGGILAIILVVLGIVSFSSAGQAASDYEKAFASWNANEKPKLLAATAAQPEKMYAFEYDEVTTEQSLEFQKKGCDATEATLKTLKEADQKLPNVPMAFLGSLNDKYSSAQQRAEERSKTLGAYTTKAIKAFEGLVADCQWNYGYNKGATPSHNAYDQAKTFMMKPGEAVGNVSCPASAKDGCIPTDPEKRKSYAEALKKFTAARATNVDTWFAKAECKQTAYGDEGCKKVHEAEKAYVAAFAAYADALAAQSSDSPDVMAKAEARSATLRTEREITAARFNQLFPAKPVAAQEADRFNGTDAFFDAVYKARIAELAAAQQPVKDLK
jgi:hypothetical protein